MNGEDSKELKAQLNLFERMVRMETKLDMALTKQTDHEGRLRVVEECIAQGKGGWKLVTAVGGISGLLGGLAGKFLHL